jgi:hypothetical protein
VFESCSSFFICCSFSTSFIVLLGSPYELTLYDRNSSLRFLGGAFTFISFSTNNSASHIMHVVNVVSFNYWQSVHMILVDVSFLCFSPCFFRLDFV